jgi:hypothetical protein
MSVYRVSRADDAVHEPRAYGGIAKARQHQLLHRLMLLLHNRTTTSMSHISSLFVCHAADLQDEWAEEVGEDCLEPALVLPEQ